MTVEIPFIQWNKAGFYEIENVSVRISDIFGISREVYGTKIDIVINEAEYKGLRCPLSMGSFLYLIVHGRMKKGIEVRVPVGLEPPPKKKDENENN